MARREGCGNDDHLAFEVIAAGRTHVFDSFECSPDEGRGRPSGYRQHRKAAPRGRCARGVSARWRRACAKG